MSDPQTPPPTCGIAFKEWAGVCEALATGRQSLILRKGGIEEGPGGFLPEHPAFWLYPTHVHQGEQGLKPDAPAPDAMEPLAGTVGLSALALVERIGRVERLDRLPALEGLHVWTAETVEKRFHYRRPGLWVLAVRVYRRSDPLAVPVTPEHAGCKTWVPLDPAISTAGLAPALSDADFRRQLDRLLDALGTAPPR